MRWNEVWPGRIRRRRAFRPGAVRLGLILWIALSSAAAGASGQAAPVSALAWRGVVPPAGGFRVQMPGDPEEHSGGHATIAGRIASTAYVVQPPGWEFRVEFHTIPWVARTLITPAGLVERSAADFLRDVGGRLVKGAQEPWHGNPSRRLTYAVDGPTPARGEALLVYAASRLYILYVTRAPEEPPAEVVTRFFDSFELTENEP